MEEAKSSRRRVPVQIEGDVQGDESFYIEEIIEESDISYIPLEELLYELGRYSELRRNAWRGRGSADRQILSFFTGSIERLNSG